VGARGIRLVFRRHIRASLSRRMRL
jgi:hypothetical protein